jgi:hypothetical protein
MNGRMVLCQGCLRVHLVSALILDANDPPGLCPDCQSQTCDCRGCLGSVLFLKMKVWASSGIQPRLIPSVISWTADGGLVLKAGGAT